MSKQTNTIAVSAIGIDTGKKTLHMIGLNEKGVIVLREKVARSRIAARLVNVRPCLVGIEAGMATHYMARELVALGHVVKQVPPAFTKPFRQGHKNDFRDAHAVAEAVQRPSTRCVPITRRSTGPSGATSGAFSADRRSDSSDQSASRFSFGARHCCTPRTSLLAAAAATDRRDPHRCVVASYGQNRWRPRRGLGISR